MKAIDARMRVSLKNILFATDYSPAANAALPYVTGIARRYGSKVYAVHVRAPEVYGTALPESWPVLAEAAEKLGQEEAEGLKKRLGDVPHEVLIGEGDVWGVISRIIRERDIDLVVVGTRGRTGIGKVLLGSVAEAIFRQSPCPVLTVGPRTTEDADRLLEMKEILHATDFSRACHAATPYAISLAQENQARLTLLHVIEKPAAGDLVQPADYVEATLRRLREMVPPEAELWCEPEVHVEQGAPAEKILEVAERRNADLIVLGMRRTEAPIGVATHLARATAHKIVSHAACPVLTVRG
jgi:nucleotide-binding universal stress UspA family protein